MPTAIPKKDPDKLIVHHSLWSKPHLCTYVDGKCIEFRNTNEARALAIKLGYKGIKVV